jgi:hypothetical protein
MKQARSAIPSWEYRSVVYFHAAEFASIDKYKDELLCHEAEATSPLGESVWSDDGTSNYGRE